MEAVEVGGAGAMAAMMKEDMVAAEAAAMVATVEAAAMAATVEATESVVAAATNGGCDDGIKKGDWMPAIFEA